jgi:hypothetical protein
MARSYYSTVFDQTADEIWGVIRDFGNYQWAGVVAETHIEGGRSGDAVGGIRNVDLGNSCIRQKLLVHSDLERSYTYAFCEPIPFPVRDYQATLRVTPVVDSDTAFVEWWATFDCTDGRQDHWTSHFEKQGFAKWLASLRAHLAG